MGCSAGLGDGFYDIYAEDVGHDVSRVVSGAVQHLG